MIWELVWHALIGAAALVGCAAVVLIVYVVSASERLKMAVASFNLIVLAFATVIVAFCLGGAALAELGGSIVGWFA